MPESSGLFHNEQETLQQSGKYKAPGGCCGTAGSTLQDGVVAQGENCCLKCKKKPTFLQKKGLMHYFDLKLVCVYHELMPYFFLDRQNSFSFL